MVLILKAKHRTNRFLKFQKFHTHKIDIVIPKCNSECICRIFIWKMKTFKNYKIKYSPKKLQFFRYIHWKVQKNHASFLDVPKSGHFWLLRLCRRFEWTMMFRGNDCVSLASWTRVRSTAASSFLWLLNRHTERVATLIPNFASTKRSIRMCLNGYGV